MAIKISYLISLSDKIPKSVTLEQVYNKTINPQEDVAHKTHESRRQRKLGNKNEADKLKQSCGMILPSALCQGGHGQNNIIGLTKAVMVDIDKIPLLKMAIARAKVMLDDHTLFCHVTNSEKGLRSIAYWEMVDEDGSLVPNEVFLLKNYKSLEEYLDIMRVVHDIAFRRINDYYSELTGLPYDLQTCNINRGAFLCHDPKAHYNPEAEPFFITKKEVCARLRQVRNERMRHEAEARRLYEQLRTSQQKHGSRYSNVFDLVEAWVSKRVLYVPGSHNRYICQCCYLLHEFGVDRELTLQWALMRFSDYPARSVASTVKSCYGKSVTTNRIFFS